MKNSNLKDLSNLIGDFIEYWGFKKIHGQIWTYLYLREDPIASREIREELGISKALLSLSLNELKEYEVVYSAGTGKHGVELIEANPDIIGVILNVIRFREKKMINDVELKLKELSQNKDLLKDDYPVSRSRLASLSKFVGYSSKMVNGLVKLDLISFSSWKNFRGKSQEL
ncbi:MAG: GbsR/MarR family transcriptional regulator [Bacteriovoracaceae bacterium]